MKRILWIDDLKGFILLLVCLGHICYSGLDTSIIWLSMMRMFTFFFLSGFLFSMRRYPTFMAYAKSKTKSLFIPYIYMSLLFLVISFPLYEIDFPPVEEQGPLWNRAVHYLGIFGEGYESSNTLIMLLVNVLRIFVLGQSSIWASPLWFVFTLYVVCLMFGLGYHITKGSVKKLFFITLFMGGAGFCLSGIHGIPFNMGAAFTAYFFYGLGTFFKKFYPQIQKIIVKINRGGRRIYCSCNVYSIFNNCSRRYFC